MHARPTNLLIFLFIIISSIVTAPQVEEKTVTGVQVITASQAQSIGCRRQALFVLPITEAHTGGELVWSGSETSGEQGH